MVTAKQIAALRYMIFNAQDGTDLSKRVLAFLLTQSEGLTKEVCLTLVEDREGYTGNEIHDAGLGVGAMQSSNCITRLHALLYLTGSELNYSVHYGDFDPIRSDDPFNCDGQFAGHDVSKVARPGLVRTGMPLRYTFWLARSPYSRDATLVTASRRKLGRINLKKPGLYPRLEAA